MKKKYLNSVLIVFLIIIWGAVIYKYFGKSDTSNKNIGNNVANINNQPKYNITKDTFLLKIINKFPFKASKRIRKPVQATKVKASPQKTVPKHIKKINTVWPDISYHGFVKGNHKTTRLVLLKIDKKLYRKRENETVVDLTLVKAYNDSLIVSFNNIKKTITKIHD
ncbi:hypothetical protein [Flavivirga rizhaonensis]|uniref:Uncharacterized protein n=1 Tax=Flavivirga rizhaonensis TaxID=2559571 RepID=A0A4S1DTF7_9FLAO|nr:hypothetical protein [Flavivirga rizhaonensis]TGV01065.1 hypothetical protein EM932_17040 [Flavivirga rizhaonensis]